MPIVTNRRSKIYLREKRNQERQPKSHKDIKKFIKEQNGILKGIIKACRKTPEPIDEEEVLVEEQEEIQEQQEETLEQQQELQEQQEVEVEEAMEGYEQREDSIEDIEDSIESLSDFEF